MARLPWKMTLSLAGVLLLCVLVGCGWRPLTMEQRRGQMMIRPNIDGLIYRDGDTFKLGDETFSVRRQIVTGRLSVTLESLGMDDTLPGVESLRPIGIYRLALEPIYAFEAPTSECPHHYALILVERRRHIDLKVLSMGCDNRLAFQPLKTKQVVAFRPQAHDPVGRIVTSSGTSDSLPLSTWFDDPEAIVTAARKRQSEVSDHNATE